MKHFRQQRHTGLLIKRKDSSQCKIFPAATMARDRVAKWFVNPEENHLFFDCTICQNIFFFRSVYGKGWQMYSVGLNHTLKKN